MGCAVHFHNPLLTTYVKNGNYHVSLKRSSTALHVLVDVIDATTHEESVGSNELCPSIPAVCYFMCYRDRRQRMCTAPLKSELLGAPGCWRYFWVWWYISSKPPFFMHLLALQDYWEEER